MSCNDENASLLDEGQTGSICPDVEQTRSIYNNDTRNVFKIQILVILLITLVTYFGIDTLTYSRNEWLQSKVHSDMFTNQNLTVSKICGKLNHSEPNYKKLARVQEVTAKWQMYNTIASKGVIIFTAFIYTAYTDCFGRRFLFILSSFSLFIHHFLTSLIIYFDADPLYLVGTEFLYGLTGSSYAFTAAYYSYIADLTKAGKERSMALFLAEAAYSIGGTIGTFSVGFYIKSTNFFFPSLTAACVQLTILLVCIFTIKESLPPGVRISPPPFCRVIKRSTAFFTSSEFKDRRYKFIMLLFAFAFADMTVTHRKSMESLYQLGMPFCWNSSQIAIFATARSLGENIIGLGSMKLLQKCVTDVSISLLGAVTEAASLVIEGLATNSTAMYLGEKYFLNFTHFSNAPVQEHFGLLGCVHNPQNKHTRFPFNILYTDACVRLV